MRWEKKLSQFLILILMGISAWVFKGLLEGQNMWAYICSYWFVLFVKNTIDFIGS